MDNPEILLGIIGLLITGLLNLSKAISNKNSLTKQIDQLADRLDRAEGDRKRYGEIAVENRESLKHVNRRMDKIEQDIKGDVKTLDDGVRNKFAQVDLRLSNLEAKALK